MSSKTVRHTQNCEHVRNICALAHVDHGKTTLVDSLIASNGIISQRMAGKLRYMDSRLDEQERGITMKCSSISLFFKYGEDETTQNNYLVNVIDSPGHVDFFGEVSTALQVCDGCIILVDVIEGICSQTRAAIQQAWLARVKPLLILNKIDRLFLERRMTPLDIYIHLTQILEQVNAFVGELFSAEVLSRISSVSDSKTGSNSSPIVDDNKKQIFYDWSSGLDDADDEHLYFAPENGNVIFASAIDGWGFRINDFGKYLSNKLGFSESVLKKTLWGDFYFNAKEKKIMKGAKSKSKKPLFVTFVLENLAKVYEKFEKKDKKEMMKIAESLQVKLHARDLNHSDPKTALYQLFTGWLPLYRAVLNTVCDIVPSPSNINEERIERIMCVNHSIRFEDLPPETRALKQHLMDCKPFATDSNNCVPLVVCVSKMFAFEKRYLPQNRNRPLTDQEITERRQKLKQGNVNILQESDSSVMNEQFNIEDHSLKINQNEHTVFIGFARVFSGTLKRGDWVYVLGPKHDPRKITSEIIERVKKTKLTLKDLKSDEHITHTQIKDLYLLMGRDLELVEEVSAGHVCGIGSFDKHIIKSAALSSTPYCMSFIDYFSNTIPILRVAIEPQNPSDMPILTKALSMLNQADACVDVKVQETGEQVIIVTGEVHLERCIVDLKNFLGEDFEFNVSEPIVPFRETIIQPPKVDMLNENISEQKLVITKLNKKFSNKDDKTNVHLESIEQLTMNKKFIIQVRAKPLPKDIVETLENNQKIIKKLLQIQRRNVNLNSKNNIEEINEFTQEIKNSIVNLQTQLKKKFTENDWPIDTVSKIWSVGPKFCGTNLFLNYIPSFEHEPVFGSNFSTKDQEPSKTKTINDIRYQFQNSFINGFQHSTQAGPLCEEPLMGVAFVVEQWKYLGEETIEIIDQNTDSFDSISGQITSTVKDVCRKAFQAQPQRLMAAMFSCLIQINVDVLGKMFAVIGRRHGRILENDLQEGSQMFTVNAVLPVVESFDFANEIRKQTSGKANPQLAFSHWETIDTDPFWVPTTEEEYLHFGEKADKENRALRYMNAIRRRKGLHVEEKIVEHAEKQRTLAKRK